MTGGQRRYSVAIEITPRRFTLRTKRCSSTLFAYKPHNKSGHIGVMGLKRAVGFERFFCGTKIPLLKEKYELD
jgi:hypothetical protein